jgi:hypothetical protein
MADSRAPAYARLYHAVIARKQHVRKYGCWGTAAAEIEATDAKSFEFNVCQLEAHATAVSYRIK